MEGPIAIVQKHFLPEFLSAVVCLLPMMASWEEAMTVANDDAVAKDKEVGQKVGNDLRIPDAVLTYVMCSVHKFSGR